MQAQLHYARHFALLASVAALLAVTSVWWAPAGIDVAFASYGALHAGAVTASLRAGPVWCRRLGFVVAAAVMSVLAIHVGIAVFWMVRGFSDIAFLLAIAAASIAGAAGYALLLRGLLNLRLRVVAMTATAVVCTLAALAAFEAGGLNQMGLWVAAAWWFAFSGCFWYADRNGIKSRTSNQEARQ